MARQNKQKDALSTVAARIRYAREFRVLEPQTLRQRLKEKGLAVSKQLLHRYESVESSNPNLSIIAGIAEVTDFSPGWLLFRTGPVFSVDPLTQVFRYLNLDRIYSGPKRQWPSNAALKSVGLGQDKMAQLRAQPFVAVLSDSTARALESAAEKPVGWMDAPPESLARTDRARRLVDTLRLVSEALKLNDEQRRAFIGFLSTFSQSGVKDK